MDDKIVWAVHRIKSNHSGGPTRMREYHLRQLLRKAWTVEAAEDNTASEVGTVETGTGTGTGK